MFFALVTMIIAVNVGTVRNVVIAVDWDDVDWVIVVAVAVAVDVVVVVAVPDVLMLSVKDTAAKLGLDFV